MAAETEIDRFLVKCITIFPNKAEPSREQISEWIDNMIRDCGHVVYPMCGLKDWRSKLRENRRTSK